MEFIFILKPVKFLTFRGRFDISNMLRLRFNTFIEFKLYQK